MAIPINDIDIHMKVSDVMSKPVITVNMEDKVDKIAGLLHAKKVGSVVVVDEHLNPVGVITESDIVERIVSKDKKPSKFKAKEVMSKPLNTIESSATIISASKTMRNIGVRRLICVKETKLVGVISSDDIVKVTPELITIILEEVSIGRVPPTPREAGLVGLCDSCDQWSTDIRERDGLFLCGECRIS